MGGKKGGAKVYDYLLSVDYGVCAGPIDSVNQIWVKDKPIWCGAADVRMDIPVDLPELFGGDDAEGGVSGVVEVYVGDDTQLSSDQLARRFGLTAATMPGYRGIAHLFFRGSQTLGPSDAEILAGGGTITPPATAWESVLSSLRTLYDDTASGKTANNLGFRWTTNNPYFPEVKMSITRCSGDLDPAYSRIWAYGDPATNPDNYSYPESESGGDTTAETTLIGFGQTGFTTIVTLPPNTANGLATFNAEYRVRCVYNGTLGSIPGSPAPCIYDIKFRQYDVDGNFLPNITDPGTVYDFYADTSAIVDELFNGKIHPLAKTLKITGLFEPWDPITSSMQITGTAAFRTFTLLYRDSQLHCLVDGSLGPLPDANPAHMIYECLTNVEWGASVDPIFIDVASFEDCAALLHGENFGLSIAWVAQSEVNSFIQEILNHIRAFVFPNPMTGLWQMRLLREVADADLSPVLDQTNTVLTAPKRRTWDGTINEIVVEYTDAATEKPATVTQHDLGNVQIQGRTVSDKRNYYGIRNEALAQKVADRDVAESAYPLWASPAIVSRSAEIPLPGDVRVLNWPEDGISGMIVRVMSVDYGKIGDRNYKVELVEDIFSIAKVRYREPQKTAWDSEIQKTRALSDVLVTSVPAPLLFATGVDPNDLDANYPDTPIMVLGTADNYELLDITLKAPVTAPSGVVSTKAITTLSATSSLLVDTGVGGTLLLDREVQSTIPSGVIEAIFSKVPESGDFFLIGDSDDNQEIAMLISEAAGEWTVGRGIYDTIPRTWVSPIRMWEMPTDNSSVDPIARSVGETVDYTLFPRGLSGTVSATYATNVVKVIGENVWSAPSPGDPFPLGHTDVWARPYLPFRPANAQLDIGAGPTGFDGASYNGYPASVDATWENRNKTVEDSIALLWDGGNVAPETGQTTLIRILDDTRGFVNEIEIASGVSTYNFSAGDFLATEIGVIQFWAKKDGFLSFMATELPFDFKPYGYGLGYGEQYGP